MSCEHVDIIQSNDPDMTQRHFTEEGKQPRFDPSLVTDSMLDDLLDWNNPNAFAKVFEGEDPLIPYTTVRDKAHSLRFVQSATPFGSKIGKLAPGEARHLAIALAHLTSALSSERDSVTKYNLSERDAKLVLDKETGEYNTSYDNIARVIGRDILKSRGYRLVPKTAEGVSKAAELERIAGTKAIKLLEDRNLVNIGTGNIINRRFRDSEHLGKYYDQNGPRTMPRKLLHNVKTITLKPLFNSEDADTFNYAGNLSAVQKLVLPSNFSAPSEKAQKARVDLYDMNQLPEVEEIIERAQESALAVTSTAKAALDALFRKIKPNTKSVSTLKSLTDAFLDKKGSEFLFGIVSQEELLNTYGTDNTGIEQQIGKSTSKVQEFLRLGDEWHNVRNRDLFYSFQIPKQNRLHVAEGTLNYQTDNYLSRHILGSSKVQVLDKQSTEYLMSYLMEELNLTQEEILGGKNKNLDSVIAQLSEANAQPLGTAIYLAESLADKTAFYPKAKSAWELLSYASVIKDIREGIENNRDVTTNFLVKLDATASGALLTVAQASRDSVEAEKVLLGLFKGKLEFEGRQEEFLDMYKLSTQELQKRLDRPISGKSGLDVNPLVAKENETLELIKAITNPNTGVVSSIRNLLKLPFTKFIYGQSAYNNSIEISKELSSMIIDTDNTFIIKKLLGETTETGDRLRNALVAKLVGTEEVPGVASYLVDIVGTTTGTLFTKQTQSLGNMHTVLEKARYSKESTYNKVMIIPPLAEIESDVNLDDSAAYAKHREEYGTSLEKEQEVVLPSTDKSSIITVKKNFPNLNSILVLGQHMLDSAILVRTLKRMIGKGGVMEGYKDGLMLNHDSIGSTVEFAMASEPIYKEEILNVNKEFDLVKAVLREVKHARSLTTDPVLIKEFDEVIKQEENGLAEAIKHKQKLLSTSNTIESSYGLKKELTTLAPVTKETSSVEVTDAKPQILETIEKATTRKGKVAAAIITKALNTNPDVQVQFGNVDQASYNLKENTITLPQNSNDFIPVIHEFVHAATAQKIETDKQYKNKVQRLLARTKEVLGEDNRFIQELDSVGENNLHEFMAMGLTNKDFIADLKTVSFGKKILAALKRFVLEALGLEKEDADNSVYAELLTLYHNASYDAAKINADISLSFTDAVKDTYTPSLKESSKSKNPFEVVANAFDLSDKTVSKILETAGNMVIRTSKDTLKGKELHEHLMKKYPVYNNTISAIKRQWDENTLIGKFRIYLDLDDKFDRNALNKFITQAMHSSERKIAFEHKFIHDLTLKLDKELTKDEVATLDSILAESGIFNLGSTGHLTDVLTGKVKATDLITKLVSESSLSERVKKEAVRDAEDLAHYYINKIEPTSKLISDRNLPDLTKQLSTLKAIELIKDADKIFTKIGKSSSLQSTVNELLQVSNALKTLDEEITGTITIDSFSHLGNLYHQSFNTNVELKAVPLKELNKLLSLDLGWKVLRHPTAAHEGLVYRDKGDINIQSGVGTNLKYNSNIDPLGTVLSNEELTTLGVIRNPAVSLVKAYSHKQMLLETQSIREELTGKFTYSDSTPVSRILDDIKQRKHLWYIETPMGTSFDALPREIRKLYKVSKGPRLGSESNMLVRRDIADFVEGYKELQVGTEGTTLNKAFNMLKKAVLLQKIHWVIVAPAKLLSDASSNVAYLMSRNVPITDIVRKTPKVLDKMNQLTKLRDELLLAEFSYRANPTPSNQKLINNLETRIKEHPLAAAHFNGFIQSLATELSSKQGDYSKGISKDMNTLLNYIFKDDKGSLNLAGKAIMKFSKFGVNIEDLLMNVHNQVKNRKGTQETGKAVAEELERMATHIKEIKAKDDVGAYLQEYFATPGSSLVEVGSTVLQGTDVVSKIVLYEHLINTRVDEFEKSKGRKPNKDETYKISEESALEVVKDFIDYKVNMPREVQFLEHLGVTSFMSFFLRVQRVMVKSITQNPVNAALTMIMNNLLGGATIFDANAFDREILKTPRMGIDMLLPTKLF